LQPTVKEKALRAAIKIGDGEILRDDWHGTPKRKDRDRKNSDERR
jgi:hypothetical protein